jgi:hypothetical protein
MIFSKLFRKPFRKLSRKLFRKKTDYRKWEANKQSFASPTDLGLLPDQVIYVEGYYDKKINKIIRRKYDEISSKFQSSELSAEFIYVPYITRQLQQDPGSLSAILTYRYPDMNKELDTQNISTALQTNTISQAILSGTIRNYKQMNPGFIRYLEKKAEHSFRYEYFPLVGSSKSSILRQIDHYTRSIFLISTVREDIHYSFSTSSDNFPDLLKLKKDDDKGLGAGPGRLQKFYPYKAKDCLIGDYHSDSVSSRDAIEDIEKKLLDAALSAPEHVDGIRKCAVEKILPSGDDIRKIEDIEEELLFEDEITSPKQHRFSGRSIPPAHQLIDRIISDMQQLKDLGAYRIIIEGLGEILLKQDANKAIRPSPLVIDEKFKIYLPDYNRIQIAMTPLPKTLFILFLRHPEGIALKMLINYEQELLEIYRLLSCRENYSNMVDSIKYLCNPLESSMHEKLSRIKMAFVKHISIDTAQYYIVSGERGMKWRIELDPSLVELPDVIKQIKPTKVS